MQTILVLASTTWQPVAVNGPYTPATEADNEVQIAASAPDKGPKFAPPRVTNVPPAVARSEAALIDVIAGAA